jgi:hypothetical protein
MRDPIMTIRTTLRLMIVMRTRTKMGLRILAEGLLVIMQGKKVSR